MSQDKDAALRLSQPSRNDASEGTRPAARRMTVGTPGEEREIAFLRRDGEGPSVVWLGGFRSDMRATKAEAIDAWAVAQGRACLRFDYSGHGESGGAFTDGTISRWLEDSLAVIKAQTRGASILVGSSMGGWLALLAARALNEIGRTPKGLVLIAPAVDFTERLMWAELDAKARRAIEVDGVYLRPSAYSPEPVPITRALIEDGRRHLMLDAEIRAYAPVHILQGMADPDVPWTHATTLVEHLASDPVVLTLIKDGDHRLSRPADIARLISAIEGIGT